MYDERPFDWNSMLNTHNGGTHAVFGLPDSEYWRLVDTLYSELLAWVQRLDTTAIQIRETYPEEEENPKEILEEYEDTAHHAYTPSVTGILFEVWIATLEDLIVGNQ